MINDPGARENADGSVTIQMAKRSEQLNGIADAIEKLLPNEGLSPVTLDVHNARKLWGMAQTIGIISDELKSIGK